MPSPGRLGAIPASIIALVLLAGCTGTQAPAAGPTSTVHGVADVEFDGEGGLVAGMVLASDMTPVPEADVILGGVANVTADASGVFEFQNVPPGRYTVTAHADGFHADSRSVDVLADQRTEVRFELDAIPVDEPYAETSVGVGHICLGVNVADRYLVFSSMCDSEETVFVGFPALPGVTTVVTEMEWTQTTGLTSDTLMVRLWQGGSRSGTFDCEFCYGEAVGPSPLFLRVEGPLEGVENASEADEPRLDAYVRVPPSQQNAGGVNVVFDQRVTIYNSLFYVEAAPPNFSALADN